MRLAVLFFLLAQSCLLFSQEQEETIKVPMPSVILVDVAYSAQLPEGNMKEDFLYNFALGGKLTYVKDYWFFYLGGDYQFSETVRSDVLRNLRTPSGFIVDALGDLSDVQLRQRGFFIGAGAGYLIPLSKKHRRSGIEISCLAGYEQHWINMRILSQDLVQLQGDYAKGYDRMSSGFALQQFIGYRHMDRNRLINVFAGFDFMQAFTKNRRDWDYDMMQKDDRNKVDLLLGLRAGISIPFYLYSRATERDEDIKFY